MSVDLHTHILPGLDDGPGTLEESVEMARAAVAAGVTVVAATPHVREDYPTTPEQMEEALARLRAAVAAERIPLDVRGGGELDIEWLKRIGLEEGRRFALAGNPRYLLIEFPYAGWPLGLRRLVFELQLAGITPVLAHPERNADVQADPERVRELVEAGAIVQLTTASVDGRFGPAAEHASAALLASHLAHVVASDAHGAQMRGFGTAALAAAIGDRAVADWLATGTPSAIIGDGSLPARAEPARRRPALLSRLRSTGRPNR